MNRSTLFLLALLPVTGPLYLLGLSLALLHRGSEWCAEVIHWWLVRMINYAEQLDQEVRK